MINKCLTIYKGDMYLGVLYTFMGLLLMLIAWALIAFTDRIGFDYLAKGFIMLGIYLFGKGVVVMYVAYRRWQYYTAYETLDEEMRIDEIQYTAYRIDKKQRNRRRLIYLLLGGSIISFAAIFTSEKGLLMGTFIPIALISGLEFAIGLMAEFRLQIYTRELRKKDPHPLSEL